MVVVGRATAWEEAATEVVEMGVAVEEVMGVAAMATVEADTPAAGQAAGPAAARAAAAWGSWGRRTGCAPRAG